MRRLDVRNAIVHGNVVALLGLFDELFDALLVKEEAILAELGRLLADWTKRNGRSDSAQARRASGHPTT